MSKRRPSIATTIYFVVALDTNLEMFPAVSWLQKNALIGRIRAITISEKIKTDSTKIRGVPGSCKAPEIHSAKVMLRFTCNTNGSNITGNAQPHTIVNKTNHADQAFLRYPVQITTRP